MVLPPDCPLRTAYQRYCIAKAEFHAPHRRCGYRPRLRVHEEINDLILRSRAQHGVSKDGTSQCLGPSFETAAQARGLLRMRSVWVSSANYLTGTRSNRAVRS